jgi:vacuolar-type H+-ATPase catalytic subunit A/Vma1
MRQLGDFVRAERMESHGAKSSYMEEVKRVPVQRDQLNPQSALHVGVDVADTLTPLVSTGTTSVDGGRYQRP